MKAVGEAANVGALLQALVRIPSISALSNRPLIDFAAGTLRGLGWHVCELPYRDASDTEKVNLLAAPPWQLADSFHVELAFVCHTDTVPYDPAWPHAVQPIEQNGVIAGCGSCDVKGFLACLLTMAGALTQTECASSIAIALTADEEIGCIGATHLLAAGRLRARNIVVGEPTTLHPARAGKGYCLAEVHITGRAAHSAHPADGVSAIFAAARMIAALERYADSLRQNASGTWAIFNPPCTTVNVGTIQGGTAKNVIPAECSFLLEWRPVPSEENTVLEKARAIAAEIQHDMPGLGIAITLLRQQAGFATAADAPLVRRWQALSSCSPVAVSFGTEAPLMATLGANVIVAGPGDMHTAHSSRECVPVKELEECVRLLRELVGTPGL